MFSNLLYQYDLDTNRKLLQKAHTALKPGGKVAIFDQWFKKNKEMENDNDNDTICTNTNNQ